MLAACFLILDMGLITCVEPSHRSSVVAAENLSRSGMGLSRGLLSRRTLGALAPGLDMPVIVCATGSP
jgi:hypothetical protein